MYITFNGIECNPHAIESTIREERDPTYLIMEYHKPAAMFGICTGLHSGLIIIQLKVMTCMGMAGFVEIYIGSHNSGVQFEAPEIQLGTIPSRLISKTFYNYHHYTFAKRDSADSYEIGKSRKHFAVKYKKLDASSRLYVIIGLSGGGM